MTDQELRTRVQKAVDQKLSGVKDDPWLAQRVMNRAEGEKPVVKKKLSLGLVFVLVGILVIGTALAAAIHTGFFSRVFGNETRENVETHTETMDNGKGGTIDIVFPGREFVAVDPEVAKRLTEGCVMSEPVTVRMNNHTLTILAAVRDENAMVMEMTLECPDGEKALVYDQMLNEAKGAYFADDTDIYFSVERAAEMIWVDTRNSTDTCIRLYYYCVFFDRLPDGETPMLTVFTADQPLQDIPEGQEREETIPIPACSALKTLRFVSGNGEAAELSPISLKITQTPDAGADDNVIVMENSGDGEEADPDVVPESVVVLPDPDSLKKMEIVYGDGSVYTVSDKDGYIDNTMYMCGGLGAEGLDTSMALNRLVDTDAVACIRVNGVEYSLQH